jgi:hypothetical protein
MRVFGQFALILCVCGTAVSAQTPEERATRVLADARAALGGEEKLSSVKSFTAAGRTRRVQGENLVPIEFEILVELPNKYLRKDEIPAQESDPTTTGFHGDALLQLPPPARPEPRPGVTAPPPEVFENMLKTRALTARQDFARLMLGLFATSVEAYPLTFRYIGQAEAPQGKAHVLEGTGSANFTLRLFVHTETHLPIMVSWTAPARPVPTGRGAPGAPSSPGAAAPPVVAGDPNAAKPAPSASAPTPASATASASAKSTADKPSAPEHRLYFADYRDVDGIKLPFRLRRGIGTSTTEETTFDRFRINAKIDPRRFEVRR